MARIRSIKPEFWDDDVIGALSRVGYGICANSEA